MPVVDHVESQISKYRNRVADELTSAPLYGTPVEFEDPGPGNSVPAEVFLHHLDLDTPGINRVLRGVYPYLDRNEGLKEEVHARVRFLAWMELKQHRYVHRAYNALVNDPDAQAWLGFQEGLPCYDTIREFVNERLDPATRERLIAVLVQEQVKRCPGLGVEQVQDMTPVEARRDDASAPYSPHYECRMHRLDLRWDIHHEALLVHQFYHGLAHEGRWLVPLTVKLDAAGAASGVVVVDNGYASMPNIAHSWRSGHRLVYEAQDAWRIDAGAARRDVAKRYQTHWEHPSFMVDASFEARLRFLVDHGSDRDTEAVGRYLRDAQVEAWSSQDEEARRKHRNHNEALNAELKRLVLYPVRRGVHWMHRRVTACLITMHLVQLTRLQHGVTRGLCRIANIL